MSVRMANIAPGAADVVVDGQVVGWVTRVAHEIEDEDGRWRGRVVHLWEAVTPDEYGGGVIEGMPHTYRREAVLAVVRIAQERGLIPGPLVPVGA